MRHQQKDLFLCTDRARFRTNSVRSWRLVLPDLPCLLCLSFLASGTPGRGTFRPQRPTRVLRPHPHLIPPPCISPLILSSTGLLPIPCGCGRPATISATLTPLQTYICPLPSASVRCHPTSLFLSPHPNVISIMPLLFTRRPGRPPCRPPTLVGFPSHSRV